MRRSERVKTKAITKISLGDAYGEWCQIKEGLERTKDAKITHAEVARHLLQVHLTVAVSGCCCDWEPVETSTPARLDNPR